MKSSLKILVLSGGVSREREVSLRSGLAVARACRELGHQVTEADIRPDDLTALEQQHDLIFPVLHGCFGEDGQLQQILESQGKPFVGSNSQASKLAFDKAETKRVWLREGIPTPRHLVIDAIPTLADLEAFQHVCCKPTREGSSVGVAFAHSAEDALALIGRLLPIHNQLLVEECITGRELTVGILGGCPLPIVEIRPGDKFYDYDAKYNRTDTQYLVPAVFTPQETAEIQQLAMTAFTQLGCTHYGRVDLILHPTRGPFFLEVNTIPGFTSSSLLPKAAAVAGFHFNALVENLIKLAFHSPP